MRKIYSFLLMLALIKNAYAAKLDITADNYFSLKSFSNLINENKNYNLTYYSNNSAISFTLKNINLEQTDNSWMDVGLGFRFISVEESSKTIDSIYLRDLYDYYGKSSYLYADKAYVKIYNFAYDGVIATFGKQPYTVASGLVLSDNFRGLDGAKFEIIDKYFMDSLDLFYFRSNNFFSDSNAPENIYGISANKSFGDGIWQIYYVKEKNSDQTKDISFNSKETNKNFFGVSYYLDKNNITYSSEFALQKGNSKDLSDNTINHNAYALNLKAGWKMNIPKFGKTNARFNYIKSSGNSSSSFKENKAFYSPFSKLYEGYERTGLGEIYKASAFNASKTSDTLNGLPEGLSGITAAGMGIDILKSKGVISIDYFGYKATQSTSLNKGISLGTELDIKYSLKLGEKASFYVVYATFSPKSALNAQGIKSTKLFSINVKAKF